MTTHPNFGPHAETEPDRWSGHDDIDESGALDSAGHTYHATR